MNRRVGLLAGLLFSSLWLVGASGGGCFGPASDGDTGSGGGQPQDGCADLGEEACLGAQDCSAIYEASDSPQGDCYCAPCRSDLDCPPCDCGGGSPVFVGCETRPVDPVCPAIGCAIYCEFGEATGPDGCPSCSCNPPPTGCASIGDEQSCIDAGCVPQYGGGAPECPPCTPDGVCPGCTGEAGYLGCADPVSHGECSYDGDCPAGFFCAYAGGGTGGGDCACPACEPNGPCPPCDCTGGGAAPPAYGVCIPNGPGCSMDADCGPGGHCFDGGCYFDPACQTDADCPAGTVCAPVSADPMPCDCMCDPADPNCGCACPGRPAPAGWVCVPAQPQCQTDADCGTGLCVNGLCEWVPECYSDAECPGGFCDFSGATDCADPGCGGMRPEGGTCAYPSCDDGTVATCERLTPDCAPGEVLAVRNGCWECLDARTCGATDPCAGAWLDAAGMCRGPADGALPQECCGVVCDQVVTYAADPATGTCFAFATPCDVPAGWGPCAR